MPIFIVARSWEKSFRGSGYHRRGVCETFLESSISTEVTPANETDVPADALVVDVP